MKNQFLLLQIEWKKLRRSTILLISVFAVILTAVFVFAADPNRYTEHVGWYMDEVDVYKRQYLKFKI